MIVKWTKRVQAPWTEYVGYFVSNEKLLQILSDPLLYTAELYHMVNDEEEKYNIADANTEKVEELVGLIREEIVKGIVPPMGYEGIDRDFFFFFFFLRRGRNKYIPHGDIPRRNLLAPWLLIWLFLVI